MLLQEEDQEEAVAALDLPEEASKHSRWQRLHHAQAQSLTQAQGAAAADEAFSAHTPESLTVLANEAS